MILFLCFLVGLDLFQSYSCTQLSWDKSVRLSSFDNKFPTVGLLGFATTVRSKYDCLAMCGADSDCMSFVYVSTTSLCQLVQYRWDPVSEAVSVPTARYYHLNDTENPSCGVGWQEYLGSCYYIHFSFATTYANGKLVCDTWGGHLAHINHEEENEFLKQMCRDLLDSNGNAYVACWVGLSDIVTEGVWLWDDDSQPATFTDWAPGNPNDGIHGNCVCLYHYYGHNARWGDQPCDRVYLPICEIDIT